MLVSAPAKDAVGDGAPQQGSRVEVEPNKLAVELSLQGGAEVQG